MDWIGDAGIIGTVFDGGGSLKSIFNLDDDELITAIVLEAMEINAEQNAIEAEAERLKKEAEEAAAAEAAAQASEEGVVE